MGVFDRGLFAKGRVSLADGTYTMVVEGIVLGNMTISVDAAGGAAEGSDNGKGTASGTSVNGTAAAS